MTQEEVEEIVGRYIPGTGWPAKPLGMASQDTMATPVRELEISRARVFRHSTEARFNSDWGIVHFEKGRVAWVEFSPD